MNKPLVVNYRVVGGEYSQDYHSHHEYEIYFFHAGSCRYLVHNQIYDLEPGDILLMDGMILHKPNVNPHVDYIRSVIHFSPAWIKDVLGEMNGTYLLDVFRKLHHCLIRTKESYLSKNLEKMFFRLCELRNKSQPYNLHTEIEMKTLLLHILITIHNLGGISSFKKTKHKLDKEKHAENIASYIQDNYMKKLTICTISDTLNLSKSYVSHVFKEITGFTVMEYLMACRLNQVKYLLEAEDSKPLKEIASDCGFESACHFSRYFSKKVGMTPKRYRYLRLSKEKCI
ncbi:AraC family transcriptional regulator [Priestia megaterium]|uniref:AraC family transcriptional regulator n=1 Tax=Priestia megaterium TaxID=1404 RepID=UPI003000430E